MVPDRLCYLEHMLKADAQTTKQRIIQAAFETLREDGYAGASARAIARRGGFNQALVFYHFGSVQALLLAALDETSAARLEGYRRAVADASGPTGLVDTARRLHNEDLESGHITVLSEMVAGSVGNPELGREIVARMEPWLDLVEGAIAQLTVGSPLAQLVPARDLAFGVVAFYLGIDLLAQLDGDRTRVERLFEVGTAVAPLVEGLAGAAKGG